MECDCTDKKISKSLPCEDRCLNLQRFKALYEKTGNKVYYPGMLVKFANNNHPYLKKLESKLSKLLLTHEDKILIHIDKNNSEKLKSLLVLLSRHYMLEVVILKGAKSHILTITKTADSILPQMPLSVYFEKIYTKEIKIDEGPFDAVIRFFDLSYYENTSEVDKILAEVRGEYYAEIDRNNKVKLYVWNKDSLPKIKKLLQKSTSGFSQFEAEEFKEKDDEENDVDIVVKEDDVPEASPGEKEEGLANAQAEEETKVTEEIAEKKSFSVESDEKEEKEQTQLRHVSAKTARELLFQPKDRKESEDLPEEGANEH